MSNTMQIHRLTEKVAKLEMQLEGFIQMQERNNANFKKAIDKLENANNTKSVGDV